MDNISIEVYQHDWIPGFAAFRDKGSIDEQAKAHVVLNIGSLLSLVKDKLMDKKELPYFIAESIIHETIHALEDWAKVEFNEDRIEELLIRYNNKYADSLEGKLI